MRSNRTTRFIVTATVATALVSGSVAAGVASSPATPTRGTPNQCIRRNGGDYNACNVGNSGRGDLPYQPPSS